MNCLAKNIKNPVVIKAQIHAGGRGKSGGVKVVKTKDEAVEFATKLLGKNLITYQNKPLGQPVHKILFEETENISSELYFSILCILPNSVNCSGSRYVIIKSIIVIDII